MDKVRKVFLALIVLLVTTAGVNSSYDTNAKIKAVFLYNFTKYIEWPKEYRQGIFVFGIFGDSPLYEELKNMAQTKKVMGLPIEVKKFTSLEQINDCHVLYITPEKSAGWDNISGKLNGKSTLLVTEKPGLAQQGAVINFVVKDKRQKFELNLSNAQKHQLKVSSSLEALAILVE